MTTSYKITDGLYLVAQPIDKAEVKKPVETNTNHCIIIDCSGSMYNSLPRIREQIKNRLPSLAKPGDTATIIWFSGRGSFGVLVEGHVLNTAADFTQFNAAVDRWLRPMGLTGFKEPLQEADKVFGRLQKNGFPFSLFFMSDGYDNCWNQTEILAACDKLGAHVQAATIVEYGYYADRALLTKMAERIGGTLIFAESFGDYEPTFEAAVQRRPMGKKIAVDVVGDPIGDIVWTFDGQPTVYGLNNGDVAVPAGIDQIAYLSPKPVGTVKDFSKTSPAVMDAYVGMAVFAQRMKADTVLSLLKATGDVRFIKQFTNCFGKQSYSTFGRDVTEAAADPSKRLLEGYDPNLVPRDDAFTVLDMLALLALDEGNKFYPLHPDFGYERIGRKTESAVENLTEAEQTEVAEMTLKAKNSKDLAKVQARLKEIIDSKPVPLKFTAYEENPGVDVSALTTNESRPNISVLVNMTGTVDLSPIWDKNKALFESKNVPVKFPSIIFRNYTVIADGIVNTKKLPVSLTKGSFDAFQKEGLINAKAPYDPAYIYNIDLTHLPTINRKMVETVSAKKLFEAQFDLIRIKAGNKVIGDALKKLGGVARSAGIEGQYGKEVADILAAHGITDGGFNPKVTLAEAVDTYMGRELKVGLSGLSSLPKVDDVRKKDPNKHTISQKLIAEWLPALDQFDAIADEKVRRAELEKALKANREKSRDLNRTLNEQRFGVVVGQTWFTEFESLDQNTLAITTPFGVVDGKVEMIEKEFKR